MVEMYSKNNISQEDKDYLLRQPTNHTYYNSLSCGYYKVKEIVGDASEPVLIVIFSNSMDNFAPNRELRIRKNPLFNKTSIYPQNCEINIGCIIHIQSIDLENYVWNNVSKQRYKITWKII